MTEELVGDPNGPDFDFKAFNGGPLFHAGDVLPSEYLFIGHAVCPGFSRIADEYSWWKETAFYVNGYDYFRQGYDYRYTPVALGPKARTPIQVDELEEAPWTDPGVRMALVYRNPLDQAASFYHYCISHANTSYSTINSRPLAEMPFADYLFECALPSYAKLIFSFQEMAKRLPHAVRLLGYQYLMKAPEAALSELFEHVGLSAAVDRKVIQMAARLARSEHLKRIEQELGRSLDNFQSKGGTHMRHGAHWDQRYDTALQARARARLDELGVDTEHLDWPL